MQCDDGHRRGPPAAVPWVLAAALPSGSAAIVEFCSTMTRRLGVLAGLPPGKVPDSVPIQLAAVLAG